jgi:hypothetical protein
MASLLVAEFQAILKSKVGWKVWSSGIPAKGYYYLWLVKLADEDCKSGELRLEFQQLMGASTEGTGRLPNSRFVQTLATYLQQFPFVEDFDSSMCMCHANRSGPTGAHCVSSSCSALTCDPVTAYPARTQKSHHPISAL